jgi:NB-ARC domain
MLLVCVQDMLRLLHPGQPGAVRVLGLHGMGGIGRTTLAGEVFNQLSSSCSLQFSQQICIDVGHDGVPEVQQRLLLDKLTGPTLLPKATSKAEQQQQLERCVRQGRPLLLFIDDLWTAEQRDALLCMDALPAGSRVLLTARNRSVLPAEGGACVWRPVHTLEEEAARQLLCWYAFAAAPEPLGQKQQEMVRLALRICEGLPLALEVLGSALRGFQASVCEVRT